MHVIVGNVSCQYVVDVITDYLEKSMTLSMRVRVQIHVRLCQGCRNYVKQMKGTIRILQKLPAEPIPKTTREERLKWFRTWKPGA